MDTRTEPSDDVLARCHRYFNTSPTARKVWLSRSESSKKDSGKPEGGQLLAAAKQYLVTKVTKASRSQPCC